MLFPKYEEPTIIEPKTKLAIATINMNKLWPLITGIRILQGNIKAGSKSSAELVVEDPRIGKSFQALFAKRELLFPDSTESFLVLGELAFVMFRLLTSDKY
jgi:hypothetical protein